MSLIISPFGRLLNLLKPRNEIRVLAYHRVNVEKDSGKGSEWNVTPERFKAQMGLIKQGGYEVLTVREALEYLNCGADFPERAICLTFDDGYRDNYTFALPILERFNLKATFYLVTGYIGSDRVFEWIRDSKGMSDDVSVSRSEFMPLNWDQVLEMERRGMEFGSHSHSHRSLSEIDPGIIAGELGESIRELEKHLSDGAYSFACPFGVWREAAEKLKELVQGSGYSGAFLGKWGALKKKAHPYDMPRLTIYGWDSLGVFQRKIGGSYDWLHFLYSGWHFLRTSILGKNRKQEKGFG
jgi:peptidoglycan/xylan/chitin deacetylase (PgdA/CDA1 family)